MPQPLDEAQIRQGLLSLEGWSFTHGKLLKTYAFKDFKAALVFINQVGELAEIQNHHPEIHNVWNRVALRLSTHDAGDRVTEKDLTLAHAIQSLAVS